LPHDEESEEGSEQPKRRRVEQVPLGIRKPKAPQFDASHLVDHQKTIDEEREAEQQKVVEEEPLEVPDVHQDYEIRDGDEFDRHLEGIISANAIKELIEQAREEVEDELGTKLRTFSQTRMDELMIFTDEAVKGYGEEQGYLELKKRVKELAAEDRRKASEELDRKKEAYLRSSGK
jgi:hypothetical protein